MSWCGFKNRYQKDMCLQEVGLCAENRIIIQNSNSQHKRGNLYDQLISTRIFILMMNKICILIMYFISLKKWASRKK